MKRVPKFSRWSVRFAAGFVATVLLPIVLLLLIEFSLYCAHRVSGIESFSPLVSSQREDLLYRPYIAHKDCTKIAVFGGSNMVGFGVELSAPIIIDHELAKQPGCHYVKSLARSGAYMTGYGDSLLETLDKFYDHILVYSGHNEALSLIDEFGHVKIVTGEFDGGAKYWQSTGDELLRAHINPGESNLPSTNFLTSKVPYFLTSQSRIIALIERFRKNPEDYVNRALKILAAMWPEAHASTSRYPDVTETQYVVSGLHTIPSRYQMSLTKLNPKKTLISTVSGNLFFPPNWSVEGGQTAHYFFDKGVAEFRRSGRVNWEDFEAANSADGFPMRVFSGVNEVIRSSAFQVLDFDKTIKARIHLGEKYSSYFSDMHHLNNIGQILLGRMFLCAMKYENYCEQLQYAALKKLEATYLNEIYQRWNLQNIEELNASKTFFWSYKMAAFGSCPLCYIRLSLTPATVLLKDNIQRYQSFVSRLHNKEEYHYLVEDSTYDFTEFFPNNPFTRQAHKSFFTGNFPKLNLCVMDNGISECAGRTTRSYRTWRD